MKKTKTRVPVTLKMWNDRRKVESTVCRSKRRIIARIKAKKWDLAYIKVNYGNGYYNDSSHLDEASLIQALDSYLENDLLKHAGIGGSR